jgi:hypothetical protein
MTGIKRIEADKICNDLFNSCHPRAIALILDKCCAVSDIISMKNMIITAQKF